MVLTAYFALSPVIGLSCHRRLAGTSARLDAGVEASGPHDFAVREPGASRQKRSRVHRIPCPTSVTIAKRPSELGRDGEDEEVIWVKSEQKYFCEGGWTCKSLFIFFRHSGMRLLAQARNPYSQWWRLVLNETLGLWIPGLARFAHAPE
jgi:hypothetical protein